MKTSAIGISALMVGIIALGLAIIPGIAMDRPLPFANEERDERPPEPEIEGGLTLDFKKFSVTLRGGKKDDQQNNAAKDQPEKNVPVIADPQRPVDREQVLKWFTISAVSCSLIGLILGPISWAREKQPALSGSAIGICCLALVWQYVVVGIAVGVAIAALLIVISHS